MDFKRLSDKAKDLVDKRGGTESLKQDAEQLREIAKGSGSMSDKAKAAVEAIKTPGGSAAAGSPVADAASEPEIARADEKVEGEHRGKHAGGGHGRGGGGGGRGRGGKGRGGGRHRAGGDQDAV